MKKIIFLFVLIFSTSIYSQKKLVNTSFEVFGVCDMCKSRIEKTAFKIKGVKDAKWDLFTKDLSIIFDSNKVTLDQIHKSIAKVGHDTKLERSSDKVYNGLPGCCLYNREEKKAIQ